MADFEFTIVTPEKVTHEGRANALTLPAWEGSLGVLPGHQASLILLKEGVVELKDSEGIKHLSVSGGFAEIGPKKVVLFAETAEQANEVDAERARLAAIRARETISSYHKREKGYQEIDVEQAEAALRRALIRLRAVELVGRRKTSN